MTFPTLGKFKRIALDTETNGLDRHGSSLPIGCSIHIPDGESHYFSWGHPSGNNCTKEQFTEWAQREIHDIEVSLVNPSFDLHMLKKIGIELEQRGARPRGVQYKCALLDEYRNDYSLGGMSRDFLGKEKGELPDLPFNLPGDIVSPYAKQDALLTYELDSHFIPLLDKQGLNAVAQLEDDLIWPVLHMELQGAKIDVPKLTAWHAVVTDEVQRREEQFNGLNVNSANQLAEAFERIGVKPDTTKKGNPSFTEAKLKEYRIRNRDRAEVVAFCDQVLELKALRSLKAKYLDSYLGGHRDGRIFYNLHQCRSTDNGTVSGRFSSSDFNIQQVASEDNLDEVVKQWVIRELFLPETPGIWCSADASQIEFRIFAHYANSARLIERYRNDPLADFHQLVAEISDLSRKPAKNLNFAKLYGAGLVKTAIMMDAPLWQAEEFSKKYDLEFPEAKTLFNTAMRVARGRSYVKTLMGRLAHFPGRQRLHSALNRVIQGTAADIMKKKLLEVYREMKTLEFNLQFTVHDEVDGTLYNPSKVGMLEDLLNSPCFDLRVPVLWNVKTGINWRLKEAHE